MTAPEMPGDSFDSGDGRTYSEPETTPGQRDPQAERDMDIAFAVVAADRNTLRTVLSRIAMGTAGDPSVAADKALTESRRRSDDLAAQPPAPARRPRLKGCVEAWPGCADGEYNPACCRFPKSCSCASYDDQVAPEILEEVQEPSLEPGASGAAPGQAARDLSNVQEVGAEGLSGVSVLAPRAKMTRDEALVHAAWLVMAAGGELEIGGILAEIGGAPAPKPALELAMSAYHAQRRALENVFAVLDRQSLTYAERISRARTLIRAARAGRPVPDDDPKPASELAVAIRAAVVAEIRDAARCDSDDGDECERCGRHADAVIAVTGTSPVFPGTAWRLLGEARARIAAVAELTAEMHARANAAVPPGAVDVADRIVRAQVLHEYAARIRQAIGPEGPVKP